MPPHPRRVPPCTLAAQTTETGMPEEGVLRVATWNIAAINNNPFEYWITHDDADYNRLVARVRVGVRVLGCELCTLTLPLATMIHYNRLMEGVQSFIDEPGARRRR